MGSRRNARCQSREGKRKEGYAGGRSSTPWPRGRADLIEPAEPVPTPALFICKVGQGMSDVVCAAGVPNDTPKWLQAFSTTSTTTTRVASQITI